MERGHVLHSMRQEVYLPDTQVLQPDHWKDAFLGFGSFGYMLQDHSSSGKESQRDQIWQGNVQELRRKGTWKYRARR